MSDERSTSIYVRTIDGDGEPLTVYHITWNRSRTEQESRWALEIALDTYLDLPDVDPELATWETMLQDAYSGNRDIDLDGTVDIPHFQLDLNCEDGSIA